MPDLECTNGIVLLSEDPSISEFFLDCLNHNVDMFGMRLNCKMLLQERIRPKPNIVLL